MAILRRARLLEEELQGNGVARTVGKGKMVLGSLNEVVRQRILKRGVKMAKTAAVGEGVEWEFCGKWCKWEFEWFFPLFFFGCNFILISRQGK
jgi:hypothetical protein